MPIGIVSDSDFQSELTKTVLREPAKGIIVEKPELGRGNGNIEVPEALRKIIGEESLLNGRASALALAKEFNISDSSVSAYAHGNTSTASYDKPSPSLNTFLTKQKSRISKRSRRILLSALDNITDDKMAEAKITDLAAVAKSMSGIIKDIETEEAIAPGMNVNGPAFVFYAPRPIKEDSLDVITVNEDF